MLREASPAAPHSEARGKRARGSGVRVGALKAPELPRAVCRTGTGTRTGTGPDPILPIPGSPATPTAPGAPPLLKYPQRKLIKTLIPCYATRLRHARLTGECFLDDHSLLCPPMRCRCARTVDCRVAPLGLRVAPVVHLALPHEARTALASRRVLVPCMRATCHTRDDTRPYISTRATNQ